MIGNNYVQLSPAVNVKAQLAKCQFELTRKHICRIPVVQFAYSCRIFVVTHVRLLKFIHLTT